MSSHLKKKKGGGDAGMSLTKRRDGRKDEWMERNEYKYEQIEMRKI